MRKPAFVLLIVCAGALLLGAAPLAAQADSLGAEVDRIFAPYAAPGSPGCAVGVVRDGRLVLARGYGTADLARGTAITSRTSFYIASTSKQFTAASIALLERQGKLSLDDDVRKYVPELPDYGARVTLRHLLHHTSGLRDYLVLLSLAGRPLDRPWTDADILELLGRQRALNFEPGSEFLYSNSGYLLLATVVRRVSGQSLREFARDQLFVPLGMRVSHFHDEPGHEMRGAALGYAPRPGGGYRAASLPRFALVGDGGIYTTVEDLARWDANFYHNRVGGAALQQALHSSTALAAGDTLSYALGLTLGSYRGLRTVGHAGSFQGFRAELLRFPDARFSSIVLCNVATADPTALARQVADAYLADRLAAAPPPEQTAPAARPAPRTLMAPQLAEDYVGRFASDELQARYTISLGQHELRLRRGALGEVSLRLGLRDTLRVDGGLTLRFQRDPHGAVTGFTLDAGRVRGIRFVREQPLPSSAAAAGGSQR